MKYLFLIKKKVMSIKLVFLMFMLICVYLINLICKTIVENGNKDII